MARAIVTVTLMLLISACAVDAEQFTPDTTVPISPLATEGSATANVEVVTLNGEGNSYTFSVTVRSDATGCDQYSDWWEVLSESGELVYRRVLLHSHVGEQPFTRSGGPVDVQQDETVIVRAHMSKSGFGGIAMLGSVMDGFSVVEPPSGFGNGVEMLEPLPSACAF